MKTSKIIIFTILVALMLVLTGCVERRLTIITNPPGALIALNDEEIGTSPATVAFRWYGDYNVRITKDGFETLNTHRKLKAPLHDSFPFDFFAEILWPGRIIDKYEWTFTLETYVGPGREKLIRHAEETRKRSNDQYKEAIKPN